MLLGSVSASAQWTHPTPESTPFAVDDTLYLYNTGAQKFFTEGNSWGTQASVDNTGLKIVLHEFIYPQLSGEDSVWGGKAYEIRNLSIAKNSIKNLFVDSETSMFVDLGSQSNKAWAFEFSANGDGSYRIFASSECDAWSTLTATNYPDSYLGVEITDGVPAAVIQPFLTIDGKAENVTNALEWIFVSPAAYETYQSEIAVYMAAQDLKAKIDEAKAAGADVAAEEAVYNNTSSTIEELNAAAESVTYKAKNIYETKYSPTEPLNMNENYLINYEFNDNSLWLYTTGAQNHGTATNQAGDFNVPYWENWNPSAYNGKMYREMTAMPQGVYKFSIATFVNGGSDAFIFINNDSVPATSSIPLTYTVWGLVEGNDTVQVGLKVVNKVNNWIGMDNADLNYYGNTAESWAYLFEQFAALTTTEDVYCCQALVDAFNTAAAAKASDVNAAVEAWEALKAASAALNENIEAYKAYQQILADAQVVVESRDYVKEAQELGDYLMTAEDEILKAGEMTTEEIIAEGDSVKAIVEYLKKVVTPGQVMDVIVNPNFDNSNTGWLVDQTTVSGATASNAQVSGLTTPYTGEDEVLAQYGSVANPNGERWNANFDYYQAFTGMQEGVYKLTAQGFYRTESNANAAANYQSESDAAKVYGWIYVNDSKAELKNIMSEPAAIPYPNGYTYGTDETGATLYTPNSQTDASYAFNAGLYNNEVYGVVTTEGNLRIGVKSEGSLGDRWTLFDNFVLTYEGKDAEVLANILEPKIDEAETLIADNSMAQESKDALTASANAAKEAVSAGDGNGMFDAYIDILAKIADAEASIAVYTKLSDALTNLEMAIDEYSATASAEALNAAVEIADATSTALETGSYTNEEVENAIAEIGKVITQLKIIPVEEYPADYSNLIVNATYDNNDNTGWTGTAPGFQTYGNAEFYNKTFDYSQVIEGLPAGTYGVSVQGYYRAGTTANDFDAVNSENPAASQHAFLYATTSAGTGSVALPLECSEAVEEMIGVGTEVEAGNGTEKNGYVANTMESAAAYFELGKYNNNEVIVKVGEDGKLTIGLKKAVAVSADWTIWDNWVLTYYGPDSELTPTEDASSVKGIDAAAAVSVAYYSVDGARLAAPKKGINVVKSVLANGKVQVKKVLVK